jgi:hypothetical protein
MKKIQQLQMLAELERQSQEIRKRLKISRPNQVLYSCTFLAVITLAARDSFQAPTPGKIGFIHAS